MYNTIDTLQLSYVFQELFLQWEKTQLIFTLDFIRIVYWH